MPTISLCMIVRNEEAFLEQCLNSVKDLVDEIIVVDTGSTDRTKEIAARFGAKIFDFPWDDDFSAARNESLKHATQEWVLFLDADEVIAEEDHQKIRAAIAGETYLAFELPQLHYTNYFVNHPNFVEIEDPCFKGFYAVSVVRLFKRSDQIFFDYCVHETVRPSIKKLGGQIGELLAPVHHYQELKGTGNLNEKQENYFKLSLKNIKKYPDYAKSYHDVSIYYATHLKDTEKALAFAKKAVELEQGDASYVLNLSYRLRDLGRFAEAVVVLNQFLPSQEDERIYRALGFCYFSQKIYQKAIRAYEKALALNSPAKAQIEHNLEMIKLKMRTENNET